jgi:transposase-like protein
MTRSRVLLTAWQARPLDRVYAVVFFDALRVKIRDEGAVPSKAVYLALGVRTDGRRDILARLHWFVESFNRPSRVF